MIRVEDAPWVAVLVLGSGLTVYGLLPTYAETARNDGCLIAMIGLVLMAIGAGGLFL